MQKQIINGKPVYVFANHAMAFEAWAAECAKVERPLRILSFDYHTDSRSALWYEFCNSSDSKKCDYDKYIRKALSSFNFHDHDSVKTIRERLKHDEHIDASIRSKIIEVAFIICRDCESTLSEEEEVYSEQQHEVNLMRILGHQMQGPELPTRPYTYNMPAKRIFLIQARCPSDCHRHPHDDVCQRLACDMAIETAYLDEKLTTVQEMGVAIDSRDVLSEPYVLDIDLDYFQTRQAVKPRNPERFYDLVRNASLITIATEPKCVELLQLEGETITSEFLLEQLTDHVRKATNLS